MCQLSLPVLREKYRKNDWGIDSTGSSFRFEPDGWYSRWLHSKGDEGQLRLGFSNERLATVAYEQMKQLPFYHAFSHRSHEPAINLAEKLKSMAPFECSKVFFANSGSEANDTVVKMVWYMNNALDRPKKKKIISRIKAYHGITVASGSLTGLPHNHRSFDLPIPNILHTSCPHYYRFGKDGETEDQFTTRCAQELEELIIREGGADEVAAMICEPVMGAGGVIVPPKGYLNRLREICTAHDILLIFDEVISGFRVHPGGSQAHYGVTPDMTTLAKILAGGLPGGALVGRADLLDVIAFGNRRGKKMKHPGTYNGNPLSAAAGCAALDAIADGAVCRQANDLARDLRRRLNELFTRRNAPCVAYGEFSMIHILPNYDGPRPQNDDFIPCGGDYRLLDGEQPAALKHAFRCALLLGGVDWFGWSGMTSSTHTAEDLDTTVAAFDKALDLLVTA